MNKEKYEKMKEIRDSIEELERLRTEYRNAKSLDSFMVRLSAVRALASNKLMKTIDFRINELESEFEKI